MIKKFSCIERSFDTWSAGKREMSEGAHCPAIRSSSPCTKFLHSRAGDRRQEIERRTRSSNGASGISRLPFTPPLFLMAVLISSSVSPLHASGHKLSISAVQITAYRTLMHENSYRPHEELGAFTHKNYEPLQSLKLW